MAVFKDFVWDANVQLPGDSVREFSQINILYGRNYSGKTTLSRIVRAHETGTYSSKYSDPQFSVLWSDATTTQDVLQEHNQEIRVFNEDFVRENLTFPNDESLASDHTESFAVIGTENVKIEKEIAAIKLELGSDENGKETGLFEQLKLKLDALELAKSQYDEASQALQSKLHDKATGQEGIRNRINLFGDQNYNIAKLRNDINTILSPDYKAINDAVRQELEQGLGEDVKDAIDPVVVPTLKLGELSERVKTIVEKKIVGSSKIQELVNDYTLNEWAKKGVDLHEGKRDSCALCGEEISAERWEILKKHFDEETEHLEQDIETVTSEIESHKRVFEDGFSISKEAFYSKYHVSIDDLVADYKSFLDLYLSELDRLLELLTKRKKAIITNFIFTEPEEVPDFETILAHLFGRFDELRVQSNADGVGLDETKKQNKAILRLNEVYSFVSAVDYKAEEKRIADLEAVKASAETKWKAVQKLIDDKRQAIEALNRQRNDEENGAKRVNEYLNGFFGHQFLQLRAVEVEGDDEKQVHFEIVRNGTKAYNLSEGECNLIAFCYFIARLDDIETTGKRPIIWIDDPISSLDGNHIFFVYSLLRAEIVEKNRFEQLFVSTHSLEFLKYLKRLTGSYIENGANKNYQKAYFIVERSEDDAVIRIMPNYLKEYITEFNYLFHQIYLCANADTANDENYKVFYNFGNNARKFLEVYLTYKYPDGLAWSGREGTETEKMILFFGEKLPTFLVSRIGNEQSHLISNFERGAMPVDIPELQAVAKIICEKVKENDSEQYSALLNSIGVDTAEVGEVDA